MSWKNLNLVVKHFRHDLNKPYSWKNINKKYALANLAAVGATIYGGNKLVKKLNLDK